MNLFAVVVYIPDPLGKFLDDLRRELVPGCAAHAHVSVLPPRLLTGSLEEARALARAQAAESAPFEFSAGSVELFDYTDVIYISVERGREELVRMHDAMATGALAFPEPFPYHPHITLAQEIEPSQAQPLMELARTRWGEYPGPRSFLVERVVFVKRMTPDQWIDLTEFPLGAVQLIR